jgi:amidase
LSRPTAQTTEEPAFAGPGALAAMVRTRDVSPRELVELFLRRIESIDQRLNAFRLTLADEALAAADALAADGQLDGALAGVPVAIKDDLPVARQATTLGSRSIGAPQEGDAIAVARLRSAGAIPIGITNVPELTLWPWTASEANGITRNPWDPDRTPGGSSGGSAAAVAAALVPAATGSDGAGSIRIPAGCCGLVGMKPTRGRVSMGPGRDGWLGMAVIGALARTVADSALMLDVMQGALPGDSHPAPAMRGSFLAAAAREPGRLRVAVSRRIPPGVLSRLSGDQQLAFERTTRLLAELGHAVDEQHPSYGAVALEITQIYLRGASETATELPDPHRAERATRQLASAGRALVPAWRRDALMRRRPRTTARLLSLWDRFDVLLTPGLSRTALPAEGALGRSAPSAFQLAVRFTPWTPVFNLTGQPAITIPAGLGADGLPLCVQLVGRPGAEDTLYSLAAQLEAAAPWAHLRPERYLALP